MKYIVVESAGKLLELYRQSGGGREATPEELYVFMTRPSLDRERFMLEAGRTVDMVDGFLKVTVG